MNEAMTEAMTEARLEEIKADIVRGRKYDVPNDWDCNYEQVYDDKEELVVAYEVLQTEMEELKILKDNYYKKNRRYEETINYIECHLADELEEAQQIAEETVEIQEEIRKLKGQDK